MGVNKLEDEIKTVPKDMTFENIEENCLIKSEKLLDVFANVYLSFDIFEMKDMSLKCFSDLIW